ncbi:hypothetical protein VB618_04760 [Microvirga sp. CF3062]|uniref:hypothetical protein n=1 Tax=Microvirga sp. CF3062 TaxID=3110182 RepID=UPI002E788273|nr:hypothetical protein [Microvirga sp. CF3062]MEE1655501.1 hypothetical protein [Microvirga sp. CF3062]
MIRQIFRRSRMGHEGRFAQFAFGKKWWGMVGALMAGGATAYLLPSFADGRRETGGHLPDVADIQPAPNNAEVASRTPLNLYSSPAQEWQRLPLLASQGSEEVAAGGEVRLLALQAAFERERSSATAAQLQVVSLQEQLNDMREKREEVLVLREQLADAEAHAKQMTERSSPEVEQKKSAESARLRVAALQEELAILSTEILKDKTAAESEKVRAVSALEQLDAVQRQLAAVTVRDNDGTEINSQRRAKDDQIVDEPSSSNPRDAHPAERVSKLPLPTGTSTTSSHKQRPVPLQSVRSDKSERALIEKPRQVLLNTGVKPPTRPVNKTAAASVRTLEPDASRLTKPRHEPGNQSVRSVGKPSQGASQQSRLLVHDTHKLRDPGALNLPSDLLPDSRLW